VVEFRARPFLRENVGIDTVPLIQPLHLNNGSVCWPLIEAMLGFYASIAPEPILDATFNAGRFWEGSKRQVISMDIDPKYKPMIVADNRVMTGVPSAEFGAIIYDPPHVGPQGRDQSTKRFDVDFGATMPCGKEQEWTLSYAGDLRCDSHEWDGSAIAGCCAALCLLCRWQRARHRIFREGSFFCRMKASTSP
jgi:hypothetical protein